jgi:hypothetical protein
MDRGPEAQLTTGAQPDIPPTFGRRLADHLADA